MSPTRTGLSPSLEDYLETIYELVRDQKVARVRDIARARGVRAASVTPAMRRLADLGLVRYQQREYIDLTPAGERAARRVFSRHQMLTRFFEEVLGMPATAALADACAMEHSLSREGMDHLVRFFEFLRSSPDGRQLLALFQGRAPLPDGERSATVASLSPGARARVTRVEGARRLRDRLLDMGLLPDIVLEVRHRSPATRRTAVRVQGFDLELTREEAEAVLVAAPGSQP